VRLIHGRFVPRGGRREMPRGSAEYYQGRQFEGRFVCKLQITWKTIQGAFHVQEKDKRKKGERKRKEEKRKDNRLVGETKRVIENNPKVGKLVYQLNSNRPLVVITKWY